MIFNTRNQGEVLKKWKKTRKIVVELLHRKHIYLFVQSVQKIRGKVALTLAEIISKIK